MRMGVFSNNAGHQHSVMGGMWFGMSQRECPFCENYSLTAPYDARFPPNNVRYSRDGKWVCIPLQKYLDMESPKKPTVRIKRKK